MNLREWKEEIDKMDAEKRDEVLTALMTLEKWPAFKNEFKWTGIFILARELENI